MKSIKVILLCAISISLHSCFSCDSGSGRVEKSSRSEYTNDGKYTSPSGRRQNQYQGSREQKRDLDMIDEYLRENPDF